MGSGPTEEEKQRILAKIAEQAAKDKADAQRRKDAEDMARRKAAVKNERRGG